MKYKAVIETDDYIDFKFFEDGNGKYMVGKDAGATPFEEWIPLYFTECEEESPPMVKIDLYSVIKQKYIERDALDKIRNEIKAMGGDIETISGALDIIDKYKAESEEIENGKC